MKNNFQYIDFFMKPSISEPIVYYITEHQEGQRKLGMTYNRFKEFLFGNFEIVDKEGIIKALDSHYVIHLNGITGEWESKTIYEGVKEPSFEVLLKLNNKTEEDLNPIYTGYRNKMKNSLNDWMDQRNVFKTRNFFR